MRSRTLAVAVLGAALSAQQTKVVPAGMDHVEGQLSFAFLFGRVDADVGTVLFTQAVALFSGGPAPALSDAEGLVLGSPQPLSIGEVIVFWTGSQWIQFPANIELVPVVRLEGTFP